VTVAAFAVSAAVACLALSSAFAQRAPLRETLALHRPRTSAMRMIVYSGGLLGLSILTKLALVTSGAYEGSGLAELDAAIAPETLSDGLTLVFAAALGPGIAEELLFRGIVLGSLAARFGPGIAVLGAAALFGLFHADPVHIAGAVPLGLFLGAIRIVTGSTLAAAFCHVVNNALAITLMASPEAVASAVVLTSILCLLPSLVWIRQNWPVPSPGPVAAAESDG
jgi:membrane protease YdiL (CAAX protease family)